MKNKFGDFRYLDSLVDLLKDLDVDNSSGIYSGYVNTRPSLPRPNMPPPTQRSSPPDQKENEKKDDIKDE